MPDANNILSGSPSQIAIHDSSNGTLYLGYLSAEKVSLYQKPLIHRDISGLWYQYGTRTTLKAEMLETDPTKIADLKNRRTTKQDIYITIAEYGVKLHDIYIQLAQKREFTVSKPSVIELTAHTDIEDDVEVIKNLLSSVVDSVDYGNFNIDTNTDGISDGWSELGSLTSYARNTPSFLGAGYGHDQEIYANIIGSDTGLYCDINWPIDQVIRITGSVYSKYDTDYDSTFKIQIRTKTSADAAIDTKESGELTATGSAVRYSYTVEFKPGANAYKIAMYIIIEGTEKSHLLFDNAQLEFGSLSDYTEND